jgi:hypothetical protein
MLQDREKPQVGSTVRDELKRLRNRVQQDSSVGGDLKRLLQERRIAGDPDPSSLGLAPNGATQMQDVMRRVQMLEELQHSRALRGLSPSV